MAKKKDKVSIHKRCGQPIDQNEEGQYGCPECGMVIYPGCEKMFIDFREKQ